MEDRKSWKTISQLAFTIGAGSLSLRAIIPTLIDVVPPNSPATIPPSFTVLPNTGFGYKHAHGVACLDERNRLQSHQRGSESALIGESRKCRAETRGRHFFWPEPHAPQGLDSVCSRYCFLEDMSDGKQAIFGPIRWSSRRFFQWAMATSDSGTFFVSRRIFITTGRDRPKLLVFKVNSAQRASRNSPGRTQTAFKSHKPSGVFRSSPIFVQGRQIAG